MKKQQKNQDQEIQDNQESNDKNCEKAITDELTETLQRLQAEFENYKKRVDKENILFIKNANSQLIKDLLPVLDSFELAIKNSNTENPDIAKYRKGLELIYAQFFSILEDQGLTIIDTKDRRFDPYLHEVLMVKESDDDDFILQEFQKGYMLNGNVLRHSKVMISRKPLTGTSGNEEAEMLEGGKNG